MTAGLVSGTPVRVGDGRTLVRLAAGDGVATVTLARPRMHNALVPELLLDLCVALETAGRREDVRCVLLLAEGETFSIGCDLRRLWQEMQGRSLAAYAAELAGLLNQAMLTLMRLPQPVVAGVHGAVSAGALGLVLASDVVVAARDVRLSAGHREAGVSPDGGWTALLPRLVGLRRAGAGLLLDRTIDADQARDWGIVTDVVASTELRGAARAAALRIASSPADAMRSAKRVLQVDLVEVEAALEQERLRFIEAVTTAAAREGVARLLGESAEYPDDPTA